MAFSSRAYLLSHLRGYHRSCQTYCCKMGSCKAIRTTYTSYRVHLYRQHATVQTSESAIAQVNNNDLVSEFSYDLVHTEQSGEATTTSTSPATSVSFSDACLKLNLTMLEKFSLPRSVSRNIMLMFINVFEDFKDISPTELGQVVDQSQSEYIFRKSLLSIGLIEPIEKFPSQQRNLSYQYIPILRVLEQYISHKDVTESMDRNFSNSSNGLLNNFCDGTLFIDHPFFKSDRSLLRIHLYVDDLELCNPLGGSRVVHKLTCFYFVLGNVEMKYLSSLRNIHPVIIVKSSVVKKVGYAAILDPLYEDLKILETSGIAVTLHNGQTSQFRGGLVTITADNLASHDLAGFRRSFSSGRICRFCMCHYQDLTRKFSEDMFQIRNSSDHECHVRDVGRDPSLESVYGVRMGSPLSGLLSFNIIDGMPPDIMHDILEGVMPGILQYIIDSLILCTMTKSDLIELVQSFPYGRYEKRNKPHYKGTVSSLTATQSWCLFNHFGFIVGTYVKEGDDTWELYLMLSRITDIIFAKRVSTNMVNELDVVVVDFYKKVLECAPQVIKPKFHYMLHYATMIKKYGPISHLWSIRFESYHQIVKKISRSSGNFKNISLTVASRLQQRKCWEMTSTNCLCDSPPNINIENISASTIPNCYAGLLDFQSFPEEMKIGSAKLYDDGCERYHCNGIYVVGENDDCPIFCKVEYILLIRNQWKMLGELLESSFYRHMHCYSVLETGVFHTFSPNELIYNRPLDVYSINEYKFIRLHHCVCLSDASNF